MASEQYEASANFDLENVGPFLHQLEGRLKLGLPIDRLLAQTRKTRVEATTEAGFTVSFRGKPIAIVYRVFMDDVDALDLYIFTSNNELTDAITREFDSFFAKHGL